MPAKKYQVTLSTQQREELKKMVSTGKAAARQLTRARILLLSDEADAESQKRDCDIGTALGVSLPTIGRVRQRFVAQGLETALKDKPRSGSPRKLTGKEAAHVTALACSTPPEGHAKWSLRLLAAKAVELALVDRISHQGVSNLLKKTL
jgi:Homeodomain-like domain